MNGFSLFFGKSVEMVLKCVVVVRKFHVREAATGNALSPAAESRVIYGALNYRIYARVVSWTIMKERK